MLTSQSCYPIFTILNVYNHYRVNRAINNRRM